MMSVSNFAERPLAPSIAGRLIDAVSDCVPLLGSDTLLDRYLGVVRLTGAGQVTAFAYEPDKVSCVLSRHFLSASTGGVLTAAYLDGRFRDDPLFERAMALSDHNCLVERLEDFLPSVSTRYLKRFIFSAGFRTKVSILVAEGALRMVLNLYFEGDVPSRDPVNVSLLRLMARALATHFLRSSKASEPPQALAMLSERERQVCLGILAGRKAEIIAEVMGIGPSSVVTYRQRAYQKLGISSRGQLFSICSSGPLQLT